MENVKIARELLKGQSFKEVDSKVKELLLKAYQEIPYSDFLEIAEDIFMDKNYDVRKLCTDTDDFIRYILN